MENSGVIVIGLCFLLSYLDSVIVDCDHCKTRRKTIMAMSMSIGTDKLNFLQVFRIRPSLTRQQLTRQQLKPLRCTPLQEQVDGGILCEPCNGRGWLLCGFCKGQKTNVKAENKRIYRRCPSCRAVGYLLCSNCKVYKCVTFPNYNDGKDLN